MTPEAKTKAEVQKILRAYGDGVYHFMPVANGFGRAGIPDIIVCAFGHFLSIECKAGKGKVTALQERELNKIRSAGGLAMVVYDDPEHYAKLCRVLGTLSLLKEVRRAARTD